MTLKDVSNDYAIFSLIGEETKEFMEKLGETTLAGEPHATHKLVNLAGAEVRLAVGSGLATAGATLIVPVADGLQVWQRLVEMGAVAMGDRLWQTRPVLATDLFEFPNTLFYFFQSLGIRF